MPVKDGLKRRPGWDGWVAAGLRPDVPVLDRAGHRLASSAGRA
ncbi:hypothetical protein SFR_1198 [Streptomyces sp. FR-008]|nr:hypothetical protein SFR_1198 [Streptomyces sp. FR-008]